jgi:hypothetical protein
MLTDADLFAAGAKRVERIGNAVLVLGDCREIAPKLPGPAALISDPPYGMAWNTNSLRFSGGEQGVKRGKDWGANIVGDAEPFDPEPWLALDVPTVLWGYHHFAARLPLGSVLIWLKRNDEAFGSFLSDGELAFCAGGYGVYAFRQAGGPSMRAAEGGGAGCPPHAEAGGPHALVR